jgi:4-alpha-glucanotransferase
MHRAEFDFELWLQWCLAEQLDAASAAGAAGGMTVGIIHDLPIGVHPGGADTWTLPGVFAEGMSVGAPPDMYNQQGQDWSAPPMRPDRLRGHGLQLFRDQVRWILRHAGGVRIDHVLGLFRLWWVPAGLGPGHGVYVRYDHDALVSVLVLEATRAGAAVVGEDLGTVAPWVQEYLAERGILGTSILWFEHDGWGGPRPPEQWRSQTMGSVTVHDLPPTAGYLDGEHIRLRGGLGLLTRGAAEELADDEADRGRWVEALRARGLLAAQVSAGDTEEVVLALHRYLAATPVALVAVGLPDAVGDRRTQNLPGTSTQYPNWRLPLTGPDGTPLLLEDIEADARTARLLDTVRAALTAATDSGR